MRTTFRFFAMLMLSVMLWPVNVSAQAEAAQQLPLDPQVRYGVLPNGLTYYIRHNETPKGLAEFYIAQKVGSILEEDNQRGLAHFLEHMCFNGTKNFPGTSVRDWLATKGVMFGRDLNAYTAFDQTVYNISNVPVASEAVQDSCLLILHDWADALLLEPEEIDSERGVIHQEWRRSNMGQMRILEGLLPIMYSGTRYGYRLPIGTMEVVDNFPYQALRDYYETWYRPDQQGVIVVGDIDVDRIEAKIKELFSPIEMPANPKTREYFSVPDHEGTIYAIGHDKEMTNTIALMSFLADPTPTEMRNTLEYLIEGYAKDMVSAMINERLKKVLLDPDCPAIAINVDFGNYMVSKTKEALEVTVVAKTTDIAPSLELAYTELLRAARNGFSASEYDRVRSEFLANLELRYNNRSTQQSREIVKELVDNFTDNTPATGIETEYEIYSQIAPMIPVQALDQILPQYITKDNRVITVMMPEGDGVVYPTEESLAAVIAGVDNAEIEAYVDEVKDEPLIPSLPAPGSVVSTSVDPRWDATVWTLSNGAKVYVKKTNFKEDEIRFMATANHGTSVYPDSYANSIILLGEAPLGIGTYNTTDLETYLKGKTAEISNDFSDYTTDFDGKCSPKDLPVLMELIYGTFTSTTVDEKEFASLQSMLAGYLANVAANPQYQFGVDIQEALYENPRKRQLTAEIVNGADRAQILEMATGLTSNAADFCFYFVGNVDLDVLKPLVEQYIATLPGDASKAVTAPDYVPSLTIKEGTFTKSYSMPMATPQTYLYIGEIGNVPYTLKNYLLLEAAEQILTQRLVDNVREKEGAVYSIGASSAIRRLASPNNVVIAIPVPIDPAKRDRVLELVRAEFDNLATSVTPEELKKVQEYLIKDYGDRKEKNESWIRWMAGAYRNNVDLYNDYEATVNGITPQEVADFMKQLNGQGNYHVVMLEPAE